jgi:hypothetical protein
MWPYVPMCLILSNGVPAGFIYALSRCAKSAIKSARVSRRSLRFTTRSTKPFSSRNSAGLETFGQVAFDGFADDAGAGKADEGAGFGEVDIAQHGVGSGDAARSRVGHQGK